jgi:predicted CoA-binding protein
MSAIPRDGLDDAAIRRILSLRRVAVVGASRDPAKPSGFVPEYLQRNGYEISPVNPFAEELYGRKCFKSLADVPGTIDIVDVFRPSAEAAKVVGDAIARGAKVVWLQEGIYSPEAADAAKKAGITIAWDRCMKKQHERNHGVQL